jgi:hypothetical protein
MASSASLDTVVSHWSTLLENLQASPLEFYKSVEAAMERRQIPQMKNDRVDYKEAGLFSAKREYLQVGREKFIFDICGAPFGTGFFVSWWLAEAKPKLNPFLKVLAVFGMLLLTGLILNMFGFMWGIGITVVGVLGSLAGISVMSTDGELDDGIVRALPIIGWIYERFFKPATYYRIDTMLMFQKAVHNAVLEVIDAMTTANGLRALAESERKPIMPEFYQRNVG